MEELFKLICGFFQKNGNTIVKSATEVGKAVTKHVSQNSGKYIAGAAAAGGAAAVGAAAYAAGHTSGKKEGTAEQAHRDEKKIRDIQEEHEQDRKDWNEQKKNYEDLLNDIDGE